jgi:hypothetical protein
MVQTLAFALLLAAPLLCQAQPQIESLSRCLADNTSGKDRKELARWVFLAMAVHPEIRQYAAQNTMQAAEETHRQVAQTFTRLLTESCRQQTQAAFKQGGPTALQGAFQTLGQLAMQELMSDRGVTSAMGAFERYLDQNKLNQVFGGK